MSQAELENANTLLSDADSKSIKALKDCSSVESQLQDVQVRHRCMLKHRWFT